MKVDCSARLAYPVARYTLSFIGRDLARGRGGRGVGACDVM